MKTLIKYLSLSLLLLSHQASACSLATAGIFKPSLERWEQHPGPAQKGEKGDYWEPVPAPVIKSINVTRGSSSSDGSCDDAGIISIEIALPESATYSIDEFGFYFRVVSGKLPDAIFPDVPLIGDIKDNSSYIRLAWLDGHPSDQIDLDLQVEVFLVTNGLNVGPSTVFSIKANKG